MSRLNDEAAIRRAPRLFFRLEDATVVNVSALLRQEVKLGRVASVELICPESGCTEACTLRELELLSLVPSESKLTIEDVERLGLSRKRIEQLLEFGALLEEGGDRERWWKARSSIPWHPVAEMFHSCCLHEDRRDDELTFDLESAKQAAQERLDAMVEIGGPPPATWLEYVPRPDQGLEAVTLPDLKPEPNEFFRTLLDRRTCRHFRKQPVSMATLSTLLRLVFGPRATCRIGEVGHGQPHSVVLKTSPSGGSMHPIEAYPMVCNVEGLDPGVYHYETRRHRLQPLLRTSAANIQRLVERLAEGQSFASRAAVAVLLVARLERNFWKYRNRCRTYSVVLQDAGHLSQTFYLVSTQLGLGAFYTGAVAGWVAKDELGVDDARELPIGLCACGVPASDSGRFLETTPFEPGTPSVGTVERRTLATDPESGTSVMESCESDLGGRRLRRLRITPEFEES